MSHKKNILQLYVTNKNNTELYSVFIAALEKKLPGDYSLQIVDVLTEMGKALEYNIFATPTLIKLYPQPVIRVIGDLKNPQKMLLLLGLIDNI